MADTCPKVFERAATPGHVDAQRNLGTLSFRRGDRSGAKNWWTKAANQENPVAMFNLGVLAEEDGELEEARALFRRGADLGLSEAQEALDRLASTTMSVSRDADADGPSARSGT